MEEAVWINLSVQLYLLFGVITIPYSCNLGISQNENGYISTFLEGGIVTIMQKYHISGTLISEKCQIPGTPLSEKCQIPGTNRDIILYIHYIIK